MKKSNKFILCTISTFMFSLMFFAACKNEVDNGNETTELTTTIEITTEILTTDENESEYKSENEKLTGIVQPSKDADKFFLGKVEITNFVEPNEDGYYIVEESQWTLDQKNKSVDEEVELRKEELSQFDVEVIETSTDTDASASFVYDEENYKKMVCVIEDITNDRAGCYVEKVAIRKDFREVIMYVDESTQLKDFYSHVTFMSWHIFQCQAYSGVKAKDISIFVKVAHVDTEEVLMELTLDMKTSFNISDEEWAELFINK